GVEPGDRRQLERRAVRRALPPDPRRTAVVRAALAGERVDGEFDSFAIKRFKLDQAPATPPKIMVAALRAQMLRLAGREADGAILNWLASYNVAQCVEAVENDNAEIIARIFVCPTTDTDYARNLGRMLISS